MKDNIAKLLWQELNINGVICQSDISRSQFAAFFPPGIASVSFCDHVFRTLDTDGNGYLDFKEFIMANDLIAAQNKEAKLSWAFKM